MPPHANHVQVRFIHTSHEGQVTQQTIQPSLDTPSEPPPDADAPDLLNGTQNLDSNPADTAVYSPRSALTRVPRALSMIDIPFPEGLAGHGNVSSTLALYIDESGAVRKVEVTGSPLPPPLEEAARLSFLQATFTPGEVNGKAVKSPIVVEVTFDETAPELDQQASSGHQPAPV